MNYSVKLEDFEGPLDLLLHLIRKNKINILDIPIAEITRQYSQIIADWDFFDMTEACDYLEMATRLMKIKSQLLIPRLKVELDTEDPRKELADQLREYAIYQEIAKFLEPVVSNNLLSFSKDPEYHKEFQIEEPSKIKVSTLTRALRRILFNDIDISETTVSVKPEKVTVKEKIEYLKSVLKDGKQYSLRELIIHKKDVEEVITLFLAVLELYKTGILIFEQQGKEIQIYAADRY